MYPVAVVEAYVWRNENTGRTASVYGACPWVTPQERLKWNREFTGWTLEMSNGTIGFGRKPFESEQEAKDFMAAWLKRIGRA